MSNLKLSTEELDYVRVRLQLRPPILKRLEDDARGTKRSLAMQVSWLVEEFYRDLERKAL